MKIRPPFVGIRQYQRHGIHFPLCDLDITWVDGTVHLSLQPSASQLCEWAKGNHPCIAEFISRCLGATRVYISYQFCSNGSTTYPTSYFCYGEIPRFNYSCIYGVSSATVFCFHGSFGQVLAALPKISPWTTTLFFSILFHWQIAQRFVVQDSQITIRA